MFFLRSSIAVGVVAMMLPVAQAQTAAAAKAAAVQGKTADGPAAGKAAAKAQLAAGAAAQAAPAQTPQPNPSEQYSDGRPPAATRTREAMCVGAPPLVA